MELEEQVTLTCEASGDPIPSIHLENVHRNISAKKRYNITQEFQGHETPDPTLGLNLPHAQSSSVNQKLGCRSLEVTAKFCGPLLPPALFGTPLRWRRHSSLHGSAGVSC